MGRGDKRTKRGKIAMGSFGKSRLARTPGAGAAAQVAAGTAETKAAKESKSKSEE
jgi:ribosomal small subunit protein bTHX